mgnify:FL=1
MDFVITSFITAETLRTFPIQVLVIVALTQLWKELPTGVLNPDPRYIALGVAVWIQVVTNFLDGAFLKVTLAILNGGLITLVSWKGAEMLKGVGVKQPEVKP